jgi:hypothetical protein
MLTNIHDQLAEGNFRDEGETALKLAVVDCNEGCVDKVTEEPTAPLSVAVRGNGRRNCSFISSTSQFQTATFS